MNVAHPVLSCTFVDFALAKQGDCFYDVAKTQDYGDLAASIVRDNFESQDGCDADLVRHYYAPPEKWDFFTGMYDI